MIAHFSSRTGSEQSIAEHSRNTAALAAARLATIGFRNIGYMIGLLHDLGKETERFEDYLRAPEQHRRGEIHHAPSGAIFVYERWYSDARSVIEKTTAQILAMVIYGHHGGLMDVTSQSGEEVLKQALEQDKRALAYNEAVHNYLSETAGTDELDDLFRKASDEIKQFMLGLQSKCSKERRLIFISLLTRLLLSALVDADRLDSACFDYSADPFAVRQAPDWGRALTSLNSKLQRFPQVREIDKIRKNISDECAAAVERRGNIFRLTVPTGGGKTFSSLRFALGRAVSDDKVKHIFYVIPFNTILDQNARDIRSALNGTIDILEHHSNVIFDEDDSEGFEKYTHLTERWDADLILTSMVKFLDSVYGQRNTDARRMSSLVNSVLVFDEIQALPITCRVLFECATEFLSRFCGCTILLCTATQPVMKLEPEPEEMICNVNRLFASMQRVNYHDETAVMRSAEDAAARLQALIDAYGSVLMIVNTKQKAKEIYERMRDHIRSVHLSTGMYPAHRLRLIEEIKHRDKSVPFFCVSTSLIEAGINISFPCVVRSLAGLGSILQAAGRCNRNGELDRGEVFVWQLDENLGGLPEIQAAAEITRGLLVSDPIDSIENINRYFNRERIELPERIAQFTNRRIGNYKKLDEFPLPELSEQLTIVDLLRDGFGKSAGCTFPLRAAYRTAGKYFHVIGSQTRGVLVPVGKGAQIYAALCSDTSYDRTRELIRAAGQYSVSLYSGAFDAMKTQGAFTYLERVGMYVLRDGWYDDDTGIRMAPGNMSYLEF